MDEVEQVSGLIGNIYDAALDRSLWSLVLEQTCAYVQGCASSLMSQDFVHRSGQFYYSWGDDPYYTKLYFEKYQKINPFAVPMAATMQVGAIASASDFILLDEFFASRFYKEWAQPQGYGDPIYAVLDKSITTTAAVIVVRHLRNGMVDDETRRRMGLLAPHFRRAVNISKIIDLHKVEAAALADTLDGLAAAMFLVDVNTRIVHVNVSAHAMLSEGTVLRGLSGKLAGTDPQVDRMLLDNLAAAATGDATVGTKGIAVPLTARDGERFVAHILPLTAGARRRAGTSYSAVAAVFVCKAALDLPHPLETIAGTFKLTPAELRVLMAIVEIGGVPEVAPVLGISETTVKTHLQRIFAKTDTNRQADLVKLVAGYMSPLGG
jgi:DNA-binding CsgD family transcriptional regulator/PAS domain-containing protein